MRVSTSFINNYCSNSDICEWIFYLLSLRSIRDENDSNKLVISPLFSTLNGLLRTALIDLFDNGLDYRSVPKQIWNEWKMKRMKVQTLWIQPPVDEPSQSEPIKIYKNEELQKDSDSFSLNLIAQIMKNPQQRKLRDIVQAKEYLLPFVVSFAFEHEPIRIFIHLLLNGKQSANQIIAAFADCMAQQQNDCILDDDVCALLMSIDSKISQTDSPLTASIHF